MKKILILSIFLFLFVAATKVEASESYNTFQEIEISSGKMLTDFTSEEYEEYYRSVDKRKFWGWRVKTVNKNIKAKFISETVFSYYNNGLTPITYKYELNKTVVDKFEAKTKQDIPAEVIAIAEERLNARNNKDWAKSDELRDKLTALGYQVKDGKGEYTLTKI